MTVTLTGISITDLHGSLRNVRIHGPDGIELSLTEDVANPPAILPQSWVDVSNTKAVTFSWPAPTTFT